MNAKPWIIPMVTATLTAYAHTATAECEDEGGSLVKTGYLLQASNDHGQGRSTDAKHGNANNRDNDNSNRQSDPDSTRGQARAEERRGVKDKAEHDARHAKSARRWYNPFGWKRPSEWFE